MVFLLKMWISDSAQENIGEYMFAWNSCLVIISSLDWFKTARDESFLFSYICMNIYSEVLKF